MEYWGNYQVISFDIDGTLCSQETSGDYLAAKPIVKRIELVRSLYERGHTVKLFTARGSKSGIDWREQTEMQLQQWGVPYHELIMGKPHADIYIDDKSAHPNQVPWEA